MFADVRLQTVGYALAAMLLTVPCIAAASWLRAALRLPRVLFLGLVLVVLGLAAELMFFLTMISTIGAAVCAWIAILVSLLLTFRAIVHPRVRRSLMQSDCWAPFVVTALAALAYLSSLCFSIAGSGSILVSVLTWLSLPIDNLLPHVLALHIAAHLPPKPFVLEWLSSDRPPLQAGFDLLMSAMAPPLLADSEPRYQAVSTLLQAASFGMLFTLCRLCGCAWLRSAAIVLLAWCSGFFFLNTLFVWPKLLAAAYLAVAVCVYLAPGKLTRRRAVVIGASTSLAFLSHGGVVFAVPALALVWFIDRRVRAIVPFLTAAIIAVLVLAPWTWYQNVYDPPGNRLLKWYLAGVIPVTDESFLQAFKDAYSHRSVATLAGYKMGNVVTTLGINSTLLDPTREKDREFFFVREALGVVFIPFVAALWFVRSQRRTLRLAGRLAWTALGGIAFWCLAVYLPGTTSVHVGSYLTMLLMFTGGGIVATEWLVAFVPIALWQIVDFGLNWLPVIPMTYLRTPAGIWSILLFLAVVGTCGRILVPPVLARVRPWLSRCRAEPPYRWRSLRNSVAHHRRGIFVLAASGAIIGSLTLLMGQRVLYTMPIADVAVAAAPVTTAAHAPTAAPVSARSLRTIFPVDRLGTLSQRDRPAGAIRGELPPPALSFFAIGARGRVNLVPGPKKPGTVTIGNADSIDFGGWAIDPRAHRPAAGIAIEIAGRLFPANYGLMRPDVAKALSSAALTDVGFSTAIDARDLPRGLNVVRIFVVSSDGRGYYLDQTAVRFEKD